MNDKLKELKIFAEAMLDVERLRIVGELAKGRGRVTTLAANAGVSPDAALAHLEVLSRTGIVSLGTEPGGEHTYRIDEQALADMSRRHFQRRAAEARQEQDQRPIGPGFSQEEIRFIRGFTSATGIIRHLPSTSKKPKLMAVLKYAMQDLEPGRVYTEAEFNQALSRFTRDASSVRRELVDWGFVAREKDGSAYWLKEGGDV